MCYNKYMNNTKNIKEMTRQELLELKNTTRSDFLYELAMAELKTRQ
jgi:hypothetical protein